MKDQNKDKMVYFEDQPDLYERIAKKAGISVAKAKRIDKQYRKFFKEELEKGHGVRILGVVDVFPSTINTGTGEKIVMRSSVARGIPHPKNIRYMFEQPLEDQIRRIDEDELLT